MLYKSLAPTFGLCFDWETSGSDFSERKPSENYQGISLGMAVFNTRTFEVIDTHYLEVKFDETKYKWSMQAEAIHGLTREYLEQNGLSKEDAAAEVLEFLMKYFNPNDNIMPLGHNIGYDLDFMDQLLVPFGIKLKWHHVKLDTSQASFIMFTTYKSDHLFEIAGVGERTLHNALEDVLMTIEAAKFMRSLIEGIINE